MEPWEYWVPPPLVPTYELKDALQKKAERNNGPNERPRPAYELEEFERKASKQNDESASQAEAAQERLAKVWVANEIGRSLVRSVEFASTTKTLLDRDRARLLLTLEKSARRFAEGPWPDHNRSDVARTVEPDPASAGVIVAYLVELGLGARRCGPAELDWHFEPLARLAVLHRYFQKLHPGSPNGASSLVIGSGAAVLKVTEAIAMARVVEHLNQRDGLGWDRKVFEKQWGRRRTCTGNDRDVERISEQTVDDLRRLDDVTMAFTVDQRRYRKVSALEVAGTEALEPRDQDDTRPTDLIVLNIVSRRLKSPGRS
jgi:hypothetical protein